MSGLQVTDGTRAFNPHVCGECYNGDEILYSSFSFSFNPHVCGECYQKTGQFVCFEVFFQPPRMWGMLHKELDGVFNLSGFQPPRMWGMLRAWSVHRHELYTFNPHVCGECYEQFYVQKLRSKLSTPTYVGNVTGQLAQHIYNITLSTPTYVGNVTFLSSIQPLSMYPFQPPRMWGMLHPPIRLR